MNYSIQFFLSSLSVYVWQLAFKKCHMYFTWIMRCKKKYFWFLFFWQFTYFTFFSCELFANQASHDYFFLNKKFQFHIILIKTFLHCVLPNNFLSVKESKRVYQFRKISFWNNFLPTDLALHHYAWQLEWGFVVIRWFSFFFWT